MACLVTDKVDFSVDAPNLRAESPTVARLVADPLCPSEGEGRGSWRLVVGVSDPLQFSHGLQAQLVLNRREDGSGEDYSRAVELTLVDIEGSPGWKRAELCISLDLFRSDTCNRVELYVSHVMRRYTGGEPEAEVPGDIDSETWWVAPDSSDPGVDAFGQCTELTAPPVQQDAGLLQ